MKVIVIIPAFNEESSIGHVLREIPKEVVSEVVVVDNNSTDDTAEVARRNGATVLREIRPGYGSACLAGIAYAARRGPDVIAFLDGDYSDYPQEITLLLDKLAEGYDLVLGSRVLGKAQPGALAPHARWGNLLAVFLIKLSCGWSFSDLGPFRVIRWSSLVELEMKDTNFGWTVEMQVKAVRKELRIAEVPVSYRKRIGVSKVTGTVSGTIRAGYKIIFTILRYCL